MQPAHNSLALCGLFTALMAVGALIHITVPIGIWQVTLSLQIFVAVLAGFFLGPRQGFLSILAYLVLGLAGLPVFAHGGGLGYLLKPTFGFLLGFPCAAWLTGKLAGKPSGSRGTKRLLAAALGGEMAYYAWGLVYYDVMFNLVLQNTGGIGFVRLLEVWLFSTVIPDSVICMLSVLVYRKLGPLVGR
jgi:biotin transport system substrate-specific component